MYRALDISIAILITTLLLVPCLLIAALIPLSSPGPSIYWSERIGKGGKPFQMPKFRTMMVGAPVVSTEDFHEPEQYITKLGKILRKTSIDELPQLFCVLKGEMSLVGPRPVLASQTELLKMRRLAGIDSLRPGITGWAQVNGRDNVTTLDKIEFEKEYLERRSIVFDLKILWLTLFYVLSSKGVTH